MRRGQHARALMRSLLADPSRPGQRRTRHPFNPLSEEKAVRSLRIDIVTEKTRRTPETVAPQLIVVMSTTALSGVSGPAQGAHAASVVPSEAAAHETTATRASS